MPFYHPGRSWVINLVSFSILPSIISCPVLLVLSHLSYINFFGNISYFLYPWCYRSWCLCNFLRSSSSKTVITVVFSLILVAWLNHRSWPSSNMTWIGFGLNVEFLILSNLVFPSLISFGCNAFYFFSYLWYMYIYIYISVLYFGIGVSTFFKYLILLAFGIYLFVFNTIDAKPVQSFILWYYSFHIFEFIYLFQNIFLYFYFVVYFPAANYNYFQLFGVHFHAYICQACIFPHSRS